MQILEQGAKGAMKIDQRGRRWIGMWQPPELDALCAAGGIAAFGLGGLRQIGKIVFVTPTLSDPIGGQA